MKRTLPLLLASVTVSLCALPALTTGKEPGKAAPAAPAAAVASVPAAEALAMLKAGNLRFTTNKLEHPHQTVERRAELSKSQHPFAVVLSCADSRTAPEVIFDEGLGDLFVLRVAGNVLNDEMLGSIEYAVEHLGVKLVVVLGHERCGAVKAARETIAAGAEAPGHIQSLVKAILPAVKATEGKDAEATGKANDLNVAAAIRKAGPILKEKAESGELSVVAGNYDLDTGAVEFFE